MRAFVLIAALAVVAVNAHPAKEEKDGLPVVFGYNQGDPCPAEIFYDECNTCRCDSDGAGATCTRMACPDSESRIARSVSASAKIPHIDNFSEIGECTPGQKFIDACNTCVCANDGKSAACTDMACPPVEIPHIDGYGNGKKCPAGKIFENWCDVCRCSTDGRSAFCTLIACQD